MSATATKLGLFSLALGLTLASCSEIGVTEDSELTSVDIQLPDRATLKDKVPDIEQKMNAYHLIILSEPDDPNRCTQLNRIGDYTNSAKLEAKLKQGCDYRIRLALGLKPTEDGAGASAKVSYQDVRPILQAKCVRCHPGSSVPLDSYDTAKAKNDASIDRIGRDAGAAGFMPLGGQPLTTEEKEVFAKWKADGYLEKAESTQGSNSAPKKLAKVYYMNEEQKVISKTEIQGKAKLETNIVLKLQADGREIGLGQ